MIYEKGGEGINYSLPASAAFAALISPVQSILSCEKNLGLKAKIFDNYCKNIF